MRLTYKTVIKIQNFNYKLFSIKIIEKSFSNIERKIANKLWDCWKKYAKIFRFCNIYLYKKTSRVGRIYENKNEMKWLQVQNLEHEMEIREKQFSLIIDVIKRVSNNFIMAVFCCWQRYLIDQSFTLSFLLLTYTDSFIIN